jgi:cellobiose phosphorylase
LAVSPDEKRKRSGYFSEDGLEYIITNPRLALPYINYLTNGSYCSFITHTGGGYSFWKQPPAYGINLWAPALGNDPGRFVYIKEGDVIWTPNWRPTRTDLDSWQCRVGLGYQRLEAQKNGLTAWLSYLVPLDADLEYWILHFINESEETKRFEAYPYVELLLGQHMPNIISYYSNILFNRVYKSRDMLVAEKTYWNRESFVPNRAWPIKVFFAGTREPDGFETLRDEFLGPGEGNARPRAVMEGKMSNKDNDGRSAVFAHRYDIELEPGAQERIIIAMGVVQREEDFDMVEYHIRPDVYEQRFEACNQYWLDIAYGDAVFTPDHRINHFLNIWNKYQSRVCFWWYRSDASYFICSGNETWGYRDTAQCILGALPRFQADAWERIVRHVGLVRSDGSVDQGYIRDLALPAGTPGNIDVAMWLPISIFFYLKESGNIDRVDDMVDTADGVEMTLAELIYRIIENVWQRRSPRNLVLIEKGDWNDAINYAGRRGRGESVMASEQLLYLCNEYLELASAVKSIPGVKSVGNVAKALRESLEENAWNGEWYIRGTNDEGEVLGGRGNSVGEIFINSQSWAVIAGLDRDRTAKAMDAARERLLTDKGCALFLPGWRQPDPDIGIITRFAVGTKENAAIFLHATAWATMAWAMLGDGNTALKSYRSVLPSVRSHEDGDLYQSEPYVYAEYIIGPQSEYFGEGSHSWFTGGAAWQWHVFWGHILGIRPVYQGLMLDPCLPKDWEGITVRRDFRGAVYVIEIDKPKGICTGVKRVLLDGEPIEGNIVEPQSDGSVHNVRVEMG